ncbi:hypothetical protein HG531_004137 [Fusarium graminearum]|nr:hypothetical protein HG531_004137 [Fusarium graminearum]
MASRAATLDRNNIFQLSGKTPLKGVDISYHRLLLKNGLAACKEDQCPLLLSLGDRQSKNVGAAGQAGDGADGGGLGSRLLAGSSKEVNNVGLLRGRSGRMHRWGRDSGDLGQVNTARSLGGLDLVEAEDLVEQLVGSRGTLGDGDRNFQILDHGGLGFLSLQVLGRAWLRRSRFRSDLDVAEIKAEHVVEVGLVGNGSLGVDASDMGKDERVLVLVGVVASRLRARLFGGLRLGRSGLLLGSLSAGLLLGLPLGLISGDLESVDIVASLSNDTNSRSNLHGLAAIRNHDLEHDTVVLGLNIHAGLVGLDLEQHISGTKSLSLLDLPCSNVALGHGRREGGHGEVLGGEASCRGGEACIRHKMC